MRLGLIPMQSNPTVKRQQDITVPVCWSGIYSQVQLTEYRTREVPVCRWKAGLDRVVVVEYWCEWCKVICEQITKQRSCRSLQKTHQLDAVTIHEKSELQVFTSAKEAMFSPLFVRLFASRITRKGSKRFSRNVVGLCSLLLMWQELFQFGGWFC